MLFSKSFFAILFLLIFHGANKKSLEIARNIYYLNRSNSIKKQLKYFFKNHLLKNKIPQSEDIFKSQYNKTVWLYWDENIENAPDIVKLCVQRIKDTKDVDYILLNSKNIHEYVKLPQYIYDKYDLGIISKTHFSDILRLELLHKYGGIWLDATVYISSNTFPSELLSDNLFFYGMDKPSSNGNPIFISSWAISAPPGEELISISRSFLLNYWKKFNHLSDYFLLHLILCGVMDLMPHLKPTNLGFSNNSSPHLLQLNFNTEFNEDLSNQIKKTSNIHKLSYKYTKIEPNSFLDILLEEKF